MQGRTARHGCALLAGLVVAVPALALAVGVVLSPLTPWTIAYALGLATLAVGLLLFAFQRRRARVIAAAGAALLLAVGVLRLVRSQPVPGVRLTSLPGDGGARWVARLLPEQDGSLPAARLLELGGGLNDDEGLRFADILRASYERMGAASTTATPAIATYLGLQRATAFDTVVITDPAQTKARDAVIFLHGYAGNFLVYCWEFAQAARKAGFFTVCPSVDSHGAWWSDTAERTLLETLSFVRELGAQRIVLAGLSNGAAGASVLAWRHRKELSGLILISGSRAEQAPPGLPTLVVQGSRDRMMPASDARAYARRSGAHYAEIGGGHLVFLSRHEQVRPVISHFLQSL
ncbi:MAG TPA: hypothetical protein VM686_29915 [Polyangiaceae bacterium]|nr:hypothetical protein [Polyangiaceae bacterium]